MATLYSLMDLEKENNHLIGEVKDAMRILRELLEVHKKSNGGRNCTCQLCVDSKAFLSRNKG